MISDESDWTSTVASSSATVRKYDEAKRVQETQSIDGHNDSAKVN